MLSDAKELQPIVLKKRQKYFLVKIEQKYFLVKIDLNIKKIQTNRRILDYQQGNTFSWELLVSSKTNAHWSRI